MDDFENAFSNIIAESLGGWLAKKVDALLIALNEGLPEITSLGVVFCALAMMVTGKPYKWFGRSLMVLWIGIILIAL